MDCSGEDDVVNIVPSLPGGSWKPKWLWSVMAARNKVVTIRPSSLSPEQLLPRYQQPTNTATSCIINFNSKQRMSWYQWVRYSHIIRCHKYVICIKGLKLVWPERKIIKFWMKHRNVSLQLTLRSKYLQQQQLHINICCFILRDHPCKVDVKMICLLSNRAIQDNIIIWPGHSHHQIQIRYLLVVFIPTSLLVFHDIKHNWV